MEDAVREILQMIDGEGVGCATARPHKRGEARRKCSDARKGSENSRKPNLGNVGVCVWSWVSVTGR